jgi:hypothetical protein
MNFGRGFKLAAVAICGTLILTGCAQASQKYASDSKDGVFFAIPNSWSQIPSKDLTAQEGLNVAQGSVDRLALVHWQVAYSPNKKINAKDVLSLGEPTQPIVYARVRSLTSAEIQQVSYNDMRNLVVPLTSWEDGSAAAIPAFSIITDQEAVQKGGRGVHVVFEFQNNGVNQTINQTGLLSNNHQTLVMFIVRCTTICYDKNKVEIDKAVASLTDRGAN